jgi:hypothetical protein
VISSVVRSLRDEPRAAAPPTRVWRDWALVALLLLTAAVEGIFRTDVPWRPVALVLAVALVFPLLWRRTHPLAVVAVVFGTVIALNLVTLINGPDTSVGLYTRQSRASPDQECPDILPPASPTAAHWWSVRPRRGSRMLQRKCTLAMVESKGHTFHHGK